MREVGGWGGGGKGGKESGGGDGGEGESSPPSDSSSSSSYRPPREIDVTVKCRLGVDDLDSYERLCEFVRVVSTQGQVSHFVVHARKCLLQGLSPAQNRSVPPLRHGWVFALKRDFPHLRFSLNGGLESTAAARDARRHDFGSVEGAGRMEEGAEAGGAAPSAAPPQHHAAPSEVVAASGVVGAPVELAPPHPPSHAIPPAAPQAAPSAAPAAQAAPPAATLTPATAPAPAPVHAHAASEPAAGPDAPVA